MNSTKAVRQLLIDLLIERVESHKDKFLSPIIYNELLGMEVKRNGKVEHSTATHDDQVFSYLMALYMWYEGVNMAERFGLKKVSIKTDEEIDEPLDYYNDDSVEIVDSFNQSDELQSHIEQDLNAAIKAGGIQMQEFIEKRRAEEHAQFMELVRTPLGEIAYRQTFSIPKDEPIENFLPGGMDAVNTIPDSTFFNFYTPNTDKTYMDGWASTRSVMPESQSFMLEDDGYKYLDHFNF